VVFARVPNDRKGCAAPICAAARVATGRSLAAIAKAERFDRTRGELAAQPCIVDVLAARRLAVVEMTGREPLPAGYF